jgi:hypothetical protein
MGGERRVHTELGSSCLLCGIEWLSEDRERRISQKNGTDKLAMRQINHVIAEDDRRVSKKVSSLANEFAGA